MKKLFGCVCVCQILLPVLLVLCTIAGVKANNIRVEGKTRVTGFTGDTAVVEVTLRWDNSWRDDFNWDAAWVFFKFKKRGLENPWQHAYLSSSGHVLSTAAGNEGGGYAYMVGANAGKVNGLYVMRNGISEGNVSVRLQAKWPLTGSGLTSTDFGDALNGIYVAVHAIEMVYVPYGAYYLGDASSYKSFAVGDTAAVVIDSESALTLSAKNGMPNVSLAASYPKGYAGFYVMKYETSQEQYVEFLNSLTLDQQKARVANNNFATMKRGDYVFGDIAQPSCRNGIVFIEQRKANTPVVFGNNLNPANDLFSTDDGQTLACNYMSIEDMIAYCSWSGLRPMSELEYEKACRRFYPQVPDKGEYAWNTNNGVNRLSSLSDLNFRGDEREQALSYLKNVNSGTTNSINGPVRCGLFATSSTNQTQAGATYWAVMEMSGNLKELCVSVGNPNFNGGSSGTGVYNPAYWNTSVGSYGVRGGGFNSADDLLRTSDRTEAMNYFTTITQRDSTVGFRGVYSLSGIEINGGEIEATPITICPDTEEEVELRNLQDAFCIEFPDMRFQYNWYVKKPGEAKYELIENAGGESLVYNEFKNNTASAVTYLFKRTGICTMGVAESNEVSITVGIKPVNAPSLPPSYSSIIGVSFTLPCITSGTEEVEWKAPDGNTMACNSITLTATATPQTYQVYFVNEYGCKGDATEVIIKGYSGLSSIPKHAKEYQTLGATENGVYIIDPDGPGGNAPLPVYCNMTSEGGGWMLVVNSLMTTSVSSLYTTGTYNAPHLGNINQPHKYTDAWINLIAFSMYWTEALDGCNKIENSYWKASECIGGGVFATTGGGSYCCYKRYGNAAMTTGFQEGIARLRTMMFTNDRASNAHIMWPHSNRYIYVNWGKSCPANAKTKWEYRIWVR